ncbi:hypothetical protein Q3G72_001332 [Acer saccharum]|nr:hypothetical protein Q3G72_001332 [Acer saccharum]
MKKKKDAAKLLHGCFEAEVCEALALREGLELASQHGLTVSLAEVDAARVAAMVNCFKPSYSIASFIFDDICSLCKIVGVVKCQAISRCGNSLAHNLVSLAVSSMREDLWQGSCPSCLFPGH